MMMMMMTMMMMTTMMMIMMTMSTIVLCCRCALQQKRYNSPAGSTQPRGRNLLSTIVFYCRCALQQKLRRLRTERQQQAIEEVRAMRRGIGIYQSPYSLEATMEGQMPWSNKMYRGYAEALWPCAPWWREFIRCVVRIDKPPLSNSTEKVKVARARLPSIEFRS